MAINIPLENLPILTWQLIDEKRQISEPTIVGNMAYFGVSLQEVFRKLTDPVRDSLCAVNLKTGEEIWQVPNVGSSYMSPVMLNGIVYSGGYDKHLYAIDAKTGQVLWVFETTHSVLLCVVNSDVVYFGAGSYFYAVDINTVKVKWIFDTEHPVWQIVITDGLVYFTSDDGLFVLDIITGEQRWQLLDLTNAPTVANGSLYMAGRYRFLYALDAKTGQENWRFDDFDWQYFPIVVGNTVFVVKSRSGVYALDASTGIKKWYYSGFIGSNLIIVDNLIYFGCDGFITVLNAQTGKEELSLSFAERDALTLIPRIVDDRLYIIYQKGVFKEGRFSCLNLSDVVVQQAIEHEKKHIKYPYYAHKWTFNLEKTKHGDDRKSRALLPVQCDGLFYCVSSEGYVYALDAQTGVEQWHFKAGGSLFAPPTVGNGLLYIASYKKNIFYALNTKTGVECWRFKSKDMNIRVELSLDCTELASSPVVANGVVFFGCGHKHIYALDAQTGAEKWRFKTDHYIFDTPIIIDKKIYVISGGYVHALDIQTGQQIWQMYTMHFTSTTWQIADNKLYVGSPFKKKIHAFDIHELERPRGSGEPAMLWDKDAELSYSHSFLAVKNDLLYYNFFENRPLPPAIYALDTQTGEERWKFILQKSGYCRVDNDGVYVADEHVLYQLDDETGEVLAKTETEIPIDSTFLKTEKNIYFFAKDGTLNALELVCE